jgi:[ribosomal protein S5]-alanine N-acetyltransferase
MSLTVGSEASCREFIQRSMDRRVTDGSGLNAIIEQATGKPVGMIGLLTQLVDGVDELEIGYHLLPSALGEGICYGSGDGLQGIRTASTSSCHR